MIKHLIGRGHPEFSTNHQQDVQEYFLHLMDVIEKNETQADKIQDLFKFQVSLLRLLASNIWYHDEIISSYSSLMSFFSFW